MKKRSLFAMSLISLALVACSSDEEVNKMIEQENEGTLVSLKLDFADTRTKAAGDLPTDGTESTATPEESKISNLTVVVTNADNGNVVKSVKTGTGGGLIYNTTSQKYEFTVPKGTYKFYAFANSNNTFTTGTALITDLLTASYGTGNTYTSVYANNNFLMGNENGEATEFEIGNQASYEVLITVERAAVKVTAKCENPTLTNKTPTDGEQSGENVGKISDVQFLLNGLRQKTYLMAYNGTNNNKRECPTETDYVFAHDENGSLKQNFTFTDIATTTDGTTTQNPLYCLENTQAAYEDDNTSYVVFNTKFVPAKVVKLNDQNDGLELADQTLETATPVSFYVINSGDWAGNYILASEWTTNGTTIAGLDGAPITEAMLSDVFTDGTCYFAAPINKVTDPTAGDSYPVFRNDWYDLSITAIALPGSPNIPDLNLDGVDIEVSVTTKAWNGITHNVELGK